MSKSEKIAQFNPNGVGVKNNNFIGLPFTKEESDIVLFPVTWDVTTSFSDGTCTGPQNILDSSYQLDLYNHNQKDIWKKGIYFEPISTEWLNKSIQLRKQSKKYIEFLEQGKLVVGNSEMKTILDTINKGSEELNNWVYQQTLTLLKAGKKVGLLGGEHSTPFGYYQALAETHGNFGILQIDAHMDLREAYEGFTNSHASIFFNALKLPQIEKLVQVGIRDCCDEEVVLAHNSKRIEVFYDAALKHMQYNNISWNAICEEIIVALPDKVYVSFDIDGLNPHLCPNTGTPVPGGLEYTEAVYLLQLLKKSGKEIIGFDLCEVGGTPNEWDGTIGARLTYELCGIL